MVQEVGPRASYMVGSTLLAEPHPGQDLLPVPFLCLFMIDSGLCSIQPHPPHSKTQLGRADTVYKVSATVFVDITSRKALTSLRGGGD